MWMQLTHKSLLKHCTLVGIALVEEAANVTTRLQWVNNCISNIIN